jgi:hypothetical protein
MSRFGRLRYLPLLFALGAILLWQGKARLNAKVCAPQEPQLSLQYLRRLSLDLRGHLPTVAELQKVAEEKKIPDDIIDGMLSSTSFVDQMSMYHKDLLWGNVSTVRFMNGNWQLGGNGTTAPYYIVSVSRRIRFRGTRRVSCRNVPAEFDAKGNIITTEQEVTESNGTKVMARREGYVMVAPYWDPSKKVKVCAFDAQATMSVNVNGTTRDCRTYTGGTKCACGPNLRWCLTSAIQTTLRNDLVSQTLEFAKTIIQKDRPYTDILLASDMPINGPISHFLRYQTNAPGGLLYVTPEQNVNVPAIPFNKPGWTWVQRKELHAGVLTMPLYLLKFASNRGRANRFYNAFLCSYFQAPPEGLPPASDSCHNQPDLMKRCGCQDCHKSVEPLASYWGRWAEAGWAVLNKGEFPMLSSKCSQARYRNDATCRRLYFTQPNHPDEEKFRGYLRAFVFSTQQMKANIEAGPRALSIKHIDNGDFALCTVRKMWTWFVGKAPTPQQQERVVELATLFKGNKYSLKTLIKLIVKSPEYRQGRLLNR